MRAPFELGCRPARSSRIPAFAISLLYFVIAAIRLSSGIMPASESLLALTNIINRIRSVLFRVSHRRKAHDGDRGQPRLRHGPRIAAVLRDPQTAAGRAESEPLTA